MKKWAFSFVEVIIVVTIIILLWIVAITVNNNMLDKSNNSKVVADVQTLDTSMRSYKTEENALILPGGNINFFSQSWTYVHESSDAYWAYGKFTEDTLAKRYLDLIPLDPRTNQYYTYWVKMDSEAQFEIAWVVSEDWNFIARMTWDYNGVGWISSLIRQYNWPNFVRDGYHYLPYNPQERILIATDINWKIYSQGDTITNDTGSDLEIYFSDWSVSVIKAWTSITLLELDFPKENDLVSYVKLYLNAGSIWTNATRLDDWSTFEIFTEDTTASVRWTSFEVNLSSNTTTVRVKEWEVNVHHKGMDYPLFSNESFTSSNPWIHNAGDISAPETDLPDYGVTPVNTLPDTTIVQNNPSEQMTGDNGECFLEGIMIPNWWQVEAFNTTICWAENANSIIKTCTNWVLVPIEEFEWADEYMFWNPCEWVITYDCPAIDFMQGTTPNNPNNTFRGTENTNIESMTWSYSSTYIDDACTFRCMDNYTWNGEICEYQPEEIECSWEINQAEWSYKAWASTYTLNISGATTSVREWTYRDIDNTAWLQACEFTCASWYVWDGKEQVCTKDMNCKAWTSVTPDWYTLNETENWKDFIASKEEDITWWKKIFQLAFKCENWNWKTNWQASSIIECYTTEWYTLHEDKRECVQIIDWECWTAEWWEYTAKSSLEEYNEFLCTFGDASDITWEWPWYWTCSSSNGWNTAECSANKQVEVVRWVCGEANWKSALNSGFNWYKKCSSWDLVDFKFNYSTWAWTWICEWNGGNDTNAHCWTKNTCNSNQYLDPEDWICKSKSRNIDCTWLPENAVWSSNNGITKTITQTTTDWGRTWTPNNIVPTWSHNTNIDTNQCYYKCADGYEYYQPKISWYSAWCYLSRDPVWLIGTFWNDTNYQVSYATDSGNYSIRINRWDNIKQFNNINWSWKTFIVLDRNPNHVELKSNGYIEIYRK